jgi:Raf kinase inhibitor-like YbhB/YbcL family protein
MDHVSRWLAVSFAFIFLAGCGSSNTTPTTTTAAQPGARLTVSSPDLQNGGTIDKRFTCDGAGDRPVIRWSGVPSKAVEVAVLVDDPDAPSGTFVHWTVWGIPPTAREVGASLPAGAREGANGSGGKGWTGPCPPSGTHRYVFNVYALSKHVTLAAGSPPDKVEPAVRAAAIASGSLTARYGR